MATVDDVRRLAMALPGVSEGTRYRSAAWSVGSQVFAWERAFSKADIRRFGDEPVPEPPILALRTADLGDKEALLAAHDELFTIPHFDGYAAVLVRLADCSVDQLREFVEDAWLASAPPALAARFLDSGSGGSP